MAVPAVHACVCSSLTACTRLLGSLHQTVSKRKIKLKEHDVHYVKLEQRGECLRRCCCCSCALLSSWCVPCCAFHGCRSGSNALCQTQWHHAVVAFDLIHCCSGPEVPVWRAVGCAVLGCSQQWSSAVLVVVASCTSAHVSPLSVEFRWILSSLFEIECTVVVCFKTMTGNCWRWRCVYTHTRLYTPPWWVPLGQAYRLVVVVLRCISWHAPWLASAVHHLRGRWLKSQFVSRPCLCSLNLTRFMRGNDAWIQKSRTVLLQSHR